ncbi:MAG: site-2 protease family protein [candidate division WOR-3 bacterium]|nr:site-2 protease family protein [candidate division WOR-3 bacterium]MCX7757965.1 site-2 protease family protein [candidate division WOR-3 bacterium]MDW7987229.1 site-2 protease family protein [candidate division WOR-3 bacterium]
MNKEVLDSNFEKAHEDFVLKISQREIFTAIILFALTILTTLIVGAFHFGTNPFSNFKNIWKGLPFSATLLLILLGHELSHFFTARHYKVRVSLPFFLPVPHPLIGTMGAFIRIKSPIPNRRALIRIGLSGPLISFLLAIPAVIIGLKFSKVASVAEIQGGLKIGSSLVFYLLSRIFFPQTLENADIVLHPVAFAGWLGLFVTAINLLPLGQLDGGHISYGFLSKYYKYLTIFTIVVLGVLGLLWPGWFLWLILVLALGIKHPKSINDAEPLTTTDKCLAVIGFVILIVSFVPVPMKIFY